MPASSACPQALIFNVRCNLLCGLRAGLTCCANWVQRHAARLSLRLILVKKADIIYLNLLPGRDKALATLKDIAEKTGVSVSAVSRVLNMDDSISVSAETRRKIFEAAKELGYNSKSKVKNQNIRENLKMGIAQMFEMEQIMEDVYYLYMKTALEEACFARNIETTSLFRNSQGQFVMNGTGNLDGIFAIGSFNKEEIESFHKYTDNIVFVDSTPDDEKYYAAVPNFHLGVRQAVNRLIEGGHKKIGFIGSHFTLQETRDLILDNRLYYFRNMLTEKGLYREEFILNSEMNSKSSFEVLSNFFNTSDEYPTAIFISSDAMAQGVIKAITNAGLSIPDDISLISFNDTLLSQNAMPPLSSVRVLQREIADAAVRSMEEQRKGSAHPYKTVIPCVYIERNSVKNLK